MTNHGAVLLVCGMKRAVLIDDGVRVDLHVVLDKLDICAGGEHAMRVHQLLLGDDRRRHKAQANLGAFTSIFST